MVVEPSVHRLLGLHERMLVQRLGQRPRLIRLLRRPHELIFGRHIATVRVNIVTAYLEFVSGLLDHYRIPDACQLAEWYWSYKLRDREELIQAITGGTMVILGPEPDARVHIDGEADAIVAEFDDFMIRRTDIDPSSPLLREFDLMLRVIWHATLDAEAARRIRICRNKEAQNELLTTLPSRVRDHGLLTEPSVI